MQEKVAHLMVKYTPEQRIIAFWNKVNKDGCIPAHRPELGQCWEWIGGKTSRGYGSILYNGKKDVSHRVSWVISYGEISNGLWVLHKCDNPKCVRPSHLFLGTSQDNSTDMVSKNRSGTAVNRNKLTTQDVKTIQDRYSWFEVTMKQLSQEYSISVGCVFDIIHRRNAYAE